MLHNVKVISASRAYAYDPDEVRLTMLATRQIVRRIVDAFGFEDVSLKPPPVLFSRPKRTTPPGLVFESGSMQDGEDGIIPVRSIYISSEEVVITVAAPSAFIDDAYERLLALVSEHRTPDDAEIIGDVAGIQQSSSISFRAEGFEKALSLHVIQQAASLASERSDLDAMPFSLEFSLRPSETNLDEPLPAQKYTLATRTRRNGELDTFRSIAPLGSGQHLEYLKMVDSRL